MSPFDRLVVRAYLELGYDPEEWLYGESWEDAALLVRRLIAARGDVDDCIGRDMNNAQIRNLRHLAQSVICVHEERGLW